MKKVLSVAYLGDAVYELYIRKYLLKKGIYDNGDLQKESLKFVSAKSQRKILESLINENYLAFDELELVKVGRNAKGGKCKTTDIITYRIATGFEYLLGELYLNDKIKRIEEIMSKITEV